MCKDEIKMRTRYDSLDVKQNRGRPKLRWPDMVNEDMDRNQMTTGVAEYGKHWHVVIQAGTLRHVEAER